VAGAVEAFEAGWSGAEVYKIVCMGKYPIVIPVSPEFVLRTNA
jgi:hypothetical protein